MSSSKLSPNEVLLLDQATLKAPVDNLRRLQKVTQKFYEHNLGPTSTFQRDLDDVLRKSAVASSSTSSADTPDGGAAQRAEMLKTVEGMLTKMRNTKRKLAELSAQSAAATQVASARLDHLAALPDSSDAAGYPAWARKRLSHQLSDYFLRSTPPLKRSAAVLAREEGIEELVDVELWEELAKAEKGLREGRLEEVLSWVGENRTTLKKMKSTLEFTIHLQAYIELCRARSLDAAIAYVKKNLSPVTVSELSAGGGASQMEELSRAMALLAYAPDTTCQIYQELYSPARWDNLLAHFRSTFLSLHSLPPVPLLHMSLQAGIASLKTPICCPLPSSALSTSNKSNGNSAPPVHPMEGSPSAECPICSSPLGQLAPEVPYSHHVNSTIVCSISGKVVEGDGGEGGQLVALLSKMTGEGRVYSKEGLALRASQHPEGKLVDPHTGEVFQWEDMKKVFIS
ncbi:CTLH/CRA C-terminal to lish motif domain-domain-containing protein [Leucosporidium creatinivorum]|uniref:CTLH/CRA C-terminal to lish motif domain-domain-containing protein n=1 Tax=Leucosporidium creatinivorum TaxID=106004 RepID=A0A1Y2EQ16_9BASI|nr:CTLH/CRA C-terminal to lish motif domain-domain-containing protein [Leucosporidium creatinivorum]